MPADQGTAFGLAGETGLGPRRINFKDSTGFGCNLSRRSRRSEETQKVIDASDDHCACVAIQHCVGFVSFRRKKHYSDCAAFGVFEADGFTFVHLSRINRDSTTE